MMQLITPKAIVKTFINVKNTSDIPPLMVNNSFVSYFKENTNFFNHFLVQLFRIFANYSILPTKQMYLTYERLRDFDIACGKIQKLIHSFDPNKVLGHDGMLKFTRMFKLCNSTVMKTLLIIFQDCL